MSAPAIVHLACPEGRCGRVFSGETAGDARYALRLHLEEEHAAGPAVAATSGEPEPVRTVGSPLPPTGKTIADLEAEEREIALGSKMTVRCADCLWEAEGPAREARLEWAAHRRDEHGEDGIVERVEAELAGKTRRRTTGGKRPLTLGANRLDENVRKARLAGAGRGGYRDGEDASPSAPQGEEPKPEAGRRPRGWWTRERAIEALQAFASEHGRPPRQHELRSPLPAASLLARHFGGLGAALLAAIATRAQRALAAVRAQEETLDDARGVLREALQELEAEARAALGEA